MEKNNSTLNQGKKSKLSDKAEISRRSHTSANSTGTELPLAHPSREENVGSTKTLLDILSERQLASKTRKWRASQDIPVKTYKVNDFKGAPGVSTSSPRNNGVFQFDVDCLLYSISLIMIHFTFTLLIHNQYAMTPPSALAIFKSSTLWSPAPAILLLLVASLHHRAASPFFQSLFSAASIVCGCWVVHTSNTDPYLATMKEAPPLGTLWIWSVVELRWELAAISVLFVGTWGWLKGYAFT